MNHNYIKINYINHLYQLYQLIIIYFIKNRLKIKKNFLEKSLYQKKNLIIKLFLGIIFQNLIPETFNCIYIL